MSEIRFGRLVLTNFQKIRSLTIEMAGCNVDISGENTTGKTTVANSIAYALYGKSSLGQTDFAVKTLGPDGEPLHNLEHSVELTLLVDGRPLVLKRAFREIWTKPKGQAQRVFSGHETVFAVDGVPVSKKEYEARVAAIADEETFRLLTSPVYFAEQLHWQKRRALLLAIVGDLADAEVIASNKALADLPAILGDRSLQDHKAVIAARRTAINKELSTLPARIDEATRNLPNITGIVPDALDSDIAKLRQDAEARRAAKAQIASGGAVAEAKVRLREIESELQRIKNEHAAAEQERVADLDDAVTQADKRAAAERDKIPNAEQAVRDSEQRVDEFTRKRQTLLTAYEAIGARQFLYEEGATTCPSCGQPLPAERLQEAREHAESEFNRKRAEDLEANVRQGTTARDDLARWTNQQQQAKSNLAGIRDRLATAEREIESAKAARSAVEPHPITDRPDYVEASAKQRDTEAEISRLQADSSGAVAKIDEEIQGLEGSIETLEGAKASVKLHADGIARIEELRGQEETLTAELESLERQLYLADEFTRSKVALLEGRINAKFRLARFRLFNPLVNGGLEEVCEVAVAGVPYSSLNHGHRVAAGVDVINTLAEHFGVSAPIVLDNAEALTVDIPTDAQVIRLTVSDDKALHVELANERQAV